jgi:hypothetical protein
MADLHRLTPSRVPVALLCAPNNFFNFRPNRFITSHTAHNVSDTLQIRITETFEMFRYVSQCQCKVSFTFRLRRNVRDHNITFET